ncbi:MAG: hypothetical protein KDA44_01455 [Planctomycetales bacterium]|nr:hypothetical protein [Planctomycetales bacterium]
MSDPIASLDGNAAESPDSANRRRALETAIREAVGDAISVHRHLGLPMATWQNGQVVWIPANELPASGADE